jgi:phosphatidylinositol 4-kinase
MVPDENIRRPGCLPGSTLLLLPPEEGGVLSSKARAPYHVLIEVETLPLQTTGWRDRLGFLCCKRRAVSNGTTLEQASHSGGASPSRSGLALPAKDRSVRNVFMMKDSRRPKGLFKDETWDEVHERVQATSQYGAHPHWGLISMIVKSSADDVRQEEMAYRLVKWFQRVFARHGLRRLWLRPFLILATQHDAGCLEAVPNAISIDALKKSFETGWVSLKKYFEDTFPANGYGEGVHFQEAITNFVESMAAYSIICYVLSIRDRHNGNILLDDVGHVIHVDFGFMLCGAPGGRAMQQMGGFEPSRAFKLTSELLEVLSIQPKFFKDFRALLVEGLTAVRQDAQELLALLQLSMLGSENGSMSCFDSPRGHAEAVLEDVCDRLCLPRSGGSADDVKTEQDFRAVVDRLVDDSVDHWRSRMYDTVQYVQNGIL